MSFPILYVEDEIDAREEMARILKRHYPDTYVAVDGVEGWDLYTKIKPKVLIVDLKMPRLGGIGLIKKIRAIDPHIYIIVTSAHSEKEDLLSSIHLNVNRYLIKPFNIREVIERVDDVASHTPVVSTSGKIVDLRGGCTYDLGKRLLYVDSRPHKMTKSEADILYLLAKNLNHPVSYVQFEHEIWKEIPMTKYALRTHIVQLRKKLCPGSVIENVSGQGYMLKTEA